MKSHHNGEIASASQVKLQENIPFTNANRIVDDYNNNNSSDIRKNQLLSVNHRSLEDNSVSPKGSANANSNFMNDEQMDGEIDPQFRPGQMIDLWKNLQDLLRNQFKEECQVVRDKNKKL